MHESDVVSQYEFSCNTKYDTKKRLYDDIFLRMFQSFIEAMPRVIERSFQTHHHSSQPFLVFLGMCLLQHIVHVSKEFTLTHLLYLGNPGILTRI